MFKDLIKTIVTLPTDIVTGTIEGVQEGVEDVMDTLAGK